MMFPTAKIPFLICAAAIRHFPRAALRAPARRPCLLCRSFLTMAGIDSVVASLIHGRRARRIRYRNYEHDYLGRG